MADATFQVTFTFTAGTQNQADNKRDNAVLDFALALGLPIKDENGNVVPALVAPAVRQYITKYAKDIIVEYRAHNAQKAAYNSTKTTEETNLA